jgi:pimeloyl-ACP methyl ester carboxylesterase
MAWAMVPVVFGSAFLKRYSRIMGNIVTALTSRNHARAVESQLSALAAYPANAKLAQRVHSATLVISGAEDLLAPPHSGRGLAACCGGQHHILDGVGHSVPAEAPERFGRITQDFLS